MIKQTIFHNKLRSLKLIFGQQVNFVKARLTLYLLIVCLLLFSSVCSQQSSVSVTGSITDSNKNFISFVAIELYEKQAERQIDSHSAPVVVKGDLMNSDTSDGLGKFSISGSSASTGCAASSSDAVMVFKKEGYKTTQITLKNGTDGNYTTKVVMQKEQ